MKALSVHGGGAVFDRTSCRVGRRGQYGPKGIDRLSGLEGKNSPEDMKPSSSASQSERTDEQRGDVSPDDVFRWSEGGFRSFDLRIALLKYFMGTRGVLSSLSSASNGGICQPNTTIANPAQAIICVLMGCNYTETDCYRVECICRWTSYLYRTNVENRRTLCLLPGKSIQLSGS